MKTSALVVWFILLAVTVRAAKADDSDKPLPTDNPLVVTLYQACQKGDLEEAKDLVGSGAAVDGQVGWGKMTPLMAAVDHGHLDVIKYLLDYRAKIDGTDVQGSTALLHACFEDQVDAALALIAAGADVNQASLYGRTPLMFAAQKGDDRVVQALIDHKVNLNAGCNQGPAVLWAAGNNHFSTVKLLVEAGADLNMFSKAVAKGTYDVLGDAAANGNLPMVDYLLDHGANVNGTASQGMTPLISAVSWLKSDAVQDLIDHGANVNLTDDKGNTALMVTAYKDDAASAKILLDHKADPDATESRGYTALQIAGNQGDMDVVDLLKNAGAKVTDVHILPTDKPATPLPPARAWALAVAAIYMQRDSENLHVLGGNRHLKGSQEMLKRDWNITDHDSVLMTLGTLHDVGQHTGFQAKGSEIAPMNDDQVTALIAEHPEAEAHIKALRTAYPKWRDRTGLAWDICRAANIVNAAYDAKYLSEDEAWKQLLSLAHDAQTNFTSWQELSDNYLDGREISTGRRDPNFDAVCKLLLDPNETNSAWNENPWTTNLTSN